MQNHTTKRVIEQQAAIDTVCDHCGGIFDLNDGAVNMSGNILCPECICSEHVVSDAPARPATYISDYVVRQAEHVHIHSAYNR